MSDVTKKDWKLFQEKLGGWQENYMDRLIQEYITLQQSEAAPSQKFWAINNRIREDRKRPGVQLTLEKKETPRLLAWLIRGHVISLEDLSDFSEDMQNSVKQILKQSADCSIPLWNTVFFISFSKLSEYESMRFQMKSFTLMRML